MPVHFSVPLPGQLPGLVAVASLATLLEPTRPRDVATGPDTPLLARRWHNHLNPNIRKDSWTPEEDRMILAAHIKYGNQWSYIAKLLPGR